MFLLHILLATLTVNAPKQVVMGKPFQLTYTVDERGKDIQAPEFVDFDLLAGPYTSTSSSTSIVNGKRTTSFTQTFTYTLMARREGTYTLSPASITVGRERILSQGVKITVLPEDAVAQQGSGRQGGTSGGGQSAGQQGSISSENLFVRTIVTKTRVYEQECLALTYKLYFAGVDVAQLTNNTSLPEFTGFLKQEIDLGERQTELEHYNGRNYQTFTLYQTLLFPQRSGELTIDPATFEAVIRVQVRQQVRSIFDDFFGSYQNVARALKAPGVTIHVDALPAGKPKDFSGAVGQFSLTSDISATDIAANDAVTLKLNIRGSGNMKLIKTPSIDWPEGFEPYDPKVSNNFKTTASGTSGSKSIEYLAIPRAGGEYTIPSVHFSYFDTAAKEYKTLSTPDYTIHVQRPAGAAATSTEAQSGNYANYVNKEDIKQLGSDIRYIYSNEPEKKAPATISLSLLTILLLYLIPLLLAVVLVIVMRKTIRENADLDRVRYKKANKVAQRRLKKAKKLLGENNPALVYEEIERAVWAYLSDRLSIPTADLTKDNVESILERKGVPSDVIHQAKDILSAAEFARYAPAAAGDPVNLYDDAAKLIDKLENCKL